MSAPPIATAEQIKQLLELAGICSSDEEAKSWLEHALVAAQNSNRIAKKRPLWADQKELLSDIEKTARKLTRQLQQLRSHSYSFLVFWSAVEPGTAGGFARRAVLEDETSQLRHRPKPIKRLGDLEILSILSNIEGAAKTAKDPRKGRPRKDGKQYVIDQAFAFFVRQCSFAPSGTPTGRFANFARAFYAIAVKRESNDDDRLDRQIRQALRRLPIERERAQYMSTLHKKIQDS